MLFSCISLQNFGIKCYHLKINFFSNYLALRIVGRIVVIYIRRLSHLILFQSRQANHFWFGRLSTLLNRGCSRWRCSRSRCSSRRSVQCGTRTIIEVNFFENVSGKILSVVSEDCVKLSQVERNPDWVFVDAVEGANRMTRNH